MTPTVMKLMTTTFVAGMSPEDEYTCCISGLDLPLLFGICNKAFLVITQI